MTRTVLFIANREEGVIFAATILDENKQSIDGYVGITAVMGFDYIKVHADDIHYEIEYEEDGGTNVKQAMNAEDGSLTETTESFGTDAGVPNATEEKDPLEDHE